MSRETGSVLSPPGDYNTARLHALLDYTTPDEHEAAFYTDQPLAPHGQHPAA